MKCIFYRACCALFFSFFILCSAASDSFRAAQKEHEYILSVENIFHTIKTESQLEKLLKASAKKYNIDSDETSIITAVFLGRKQAELQGNFSEIHAQLFKRALVRAKNKSKSLYIWTLISYANYCYNFGRYEYALPLFVEAEAQIKTIAQEKLIAPEFIYRSLAYFLSTAQEYDRSTKYLLKALAKSTTAKDSAALYDNLGLNQLKKKNPSAAGIYFGKALVLALKNKDSLRYAKALGNIATIRLEQGQFEQAKTLFLKDIEISKSNGNTKNTVYALNLLAKTLIKLGEYSEAGEILNESMALTVGSTKWRSTQLESVHLFQQIAEHEGDNVAELYYRKKADSLNFLLGALDGQDVMYRINWAAQQENLHSELKTEKELRQKELYLLITIILLITALLLLLANFLRTQQNKWKGKEIEYDKRVLSLALARERSENKLHSSEQSLSNFRIYLQEKNAQIVELEKEIAAAAKTAPLQLQSGEASLHKLLESHLMTAENWDRFKKAYRLEHPHMYNEIIGLFPDLTESKKRILILSQFEMTNSEMARILGVTLEGIKKAKQRLRKKYGPEIEVYLSGTSVFTH